MTTPVAPANFDGQNTVENELLPLNQAWRTSLGASYPTLFPALALAQHPRILWLGCSDSRAPETALLGLLPGEVFVHRNIANLIHPTDVSFPAVLRYALKEMSPPVQHIILCGHIGCGGCKAVLSDESTGQPPIDNWLAPLINIRNAHRTMIAALPATAQGAALAKLNVQRGVGLLNLDPTVSAMVSSSQVQVHGGIYNVGTGELVFLEGTDLIEPALEPVPTPQAALRMGEWRSQWIKGGWQMMVEGDVTFNKAYSTPPQIVMGMFGFDLSCKTRLQFSSAVSNITTTGFHMKVQADGDSCIAESAWNWIEIPQDGSYRDFQSGVWSTTSVHSATVPQTKTSEQVNFPTPYSAAPTVLVWPTSFDAPGGTVPLSVSAYTTAVTPTGFVINLDGASYSGTVSWLAYPATTSTGVSSAFYNSVVAGQGQKGNIVFAKPAAAGGVPYTARSCMSAFAFRPGQNVRAFSDVGSVTTTGGIWSGGTWGGSPLDSASASYIAIPPI